MYLDRFHSDVMRRTGLCFPRDCEVHLVEDSPYAVRLDGDAPCYIPTMGVVVERRLSYDLTVEGIRNQCSIVDLLDILYDAYVERVIDGADIWAPLAKFFIDYGEWRQHRNPDYKTHEEDKGKCA